ncbi:hypothetical protein ACHAW5_004779 [Stephanodiscus triporus]|uniref:Uncharacterized protein n=1 Tax=Stephanodiscus triporus TaxID=2934178 RepID=A0ABD3QZ15_9STRA
MTDNSESEVASLFVIDASYHPPRNITSDVRRSGIRTLGPSSVTLHSMGWYPSGKLVVLQMSTRRPVASSSDGVDGDGTARSALLDRFVEWHGRNALLLDENFEYNVQTTSCGGVAPREKVGPSSSCDAVVRWTGGDGASSSSVDDGKTTMAYARPSEILDAVARRSTTADASCSSSSSTMTMTTTKTTGRTSGRTRRRRTEWERTRRLDALLRGLEDKKSSSGKKEEKQKQRAVSEKVRSMLLKSRSEGDEKLRMEDRFHLEVVRLWDAPATTVDTTTSYRFYSLQTTAGRVASSVVPNLGNERASEFLVRFPPPADGDDNNTRWTRYRMLPNTMTLHDAQRAGWLREFD